jgi:hypothetical protein
MSADTAVEYLRASWKPAPESCNFSYARNWRFTCACVLKLGDILKAKNACHNLVTNVHRGPLQITAWLSGKFETSVTEELKGENAALFFERISAVIIRQVQPLSAVSSRSIIPESVSWRVRNYACAGGIRTDQLCALKHECVGGAKTLLYLCAQLVSLKKSNACY